MELSKGRCLFLILLVFMMKRAKCVCEFSDYICEEDKYLNGVIDSASNVDSKEECAALCCGNPQCKSFDYRADRSCQLQDKTKEEVALTTDIGTWFCQQKVAAECPGQCHIPGHYCEVQGAQNPAVQCQICDMSRSTTAWSYTFYSEGAIADNQNCLDLISSVTCNTQNIVVTFDHARIASTDISEVELTFDDCPSVAKETWSTSGDTLSATVTDIDADCITIDNSDGTHFIESVHANLNLIKTTGGIVRNHIYQYEVQCKFTKDGGAVSSSVINIGTGTEVPEVVQATTITFAPVLALFSEDTFTTGLSGDVHPFDNIFVKITNTLKPTQFKIVLTTCYATYEDNFEATTTHTYYTRCNAGASDSSFELITTGGATVNDRRYKFNAFRFPNQNSLYLHCSVRICRAGDTTTSGCEETCPSRRKRSIIGSSELAEVMTVSRKITFSNLDTTMCKDIDCPKNAHCFDLYPAVCRCDGNYVMDYDNTCRMRNLVKITNFHVDEFFWRSYDNKTSHDFVKLATEVESELMSQLNKGKDDIIALKVIDAKPGSIIFDLLMMYPTATTFEHASKRFLAAFTGKETGTKVPANSNIVAKIKRDELPNMVKLVIETNETIGKRSHVILYAAVIVVAIGVLVLTIAISVMLIKRRKRNVAKNTPVGFDNNATENY